MSRAKRATWHPTSRPPRNVDRVLVYCPTYAFKPVRSIATDLLPYVVDATHWCHVVSPPPEPPVLA